MADYSFYEGASTGAQIDETVQKGIILVNCGTVSSLPFTKSNANILASHQVVAVDLSRPDAVQGNWTVETSDGSLTISGNITTATTVKIYLARVAQTVS